MSTDIEAAAIIVVSVLDEKSTYDASGNQQTYPEIANAYIDLRAIARSGQVCEGEKGLVFHFRLQLLTPALRDHPGLGPTRY
jgi:hypothetical protein